ncbi:uncharacterized protein LOC129943813 [Eupeodes corollae]|uniref:uncharacterized protein LOC129943813 n=1 Tax=Eupeodes corollae TaxID=290404 RepID=UPI0024922538|nr:uncharacterized protein LOC129943813 [Eupeodes corollae]
MAPKPAKKSGNRFGDLDECHLSDPPDSPPILQSKRFKPSNSTFSDFPELPTKTVYKNPRFIHITSKDRPLSSISVFLLKKTIDSISTQYEKISQLRDGSLLILTKDQKIADRFITSKALGTICPSADIKLHANLNHSKGIAYAPCLINVTETEIVSELKAQNITDVYKFTKINPEGKRVPTGLMIFTFDMFKIPSTIEIGWYKTKVSEYVSNPMQCQLLGHTKKWCKKPATCETCNLPLHEDENCTRTFCANCAGPHPASSKICPRYVQSKEIIEIKTKNKCTLAEARRIHSERNPKIPYFSSDLYSTKLQNATLKKNVPIPSTSSSNLSHSSDKEKITSTKTVFSPQEKNSTYNIHKHLTQNANIDEQINDFTSLIREKSPPSTSENLHNQTTQITNTQKLIAESSSPTRENLSKTSIPISNGIKSKPSLILPQSQQEYLLNNTSTPLSLINNINNTQNKISLQKPHTPTRSAMIIDENDSS